MFTNEYCVDLLQSTSCKITTACISHLVIIVHCYVKCKLNENFTMRHRLFHLYNSMVNLETAYLKNIKRVV